MKVDEVLPQQKADAELLKTEPQTEATKKSKTRWVCWSMFGIVGTMDCLVQ